MFQFNFKMSFRNIHVKTICLYIIIIPFKFMLKYPTEIFKSWFKKNTQHTHMHTLTHRYIFIYDNDILCVHFTL